MDREYAAYVCDMEDAALAQEIDANLPPLEVDPTPDVTPLYYDETVSRLDLISDRLLAVHNAIIASADKDGKSPQFIPMQRPVTAIATERERRDRNELLMIEQQIFGTGLA